jgi:hypothetical protein
MKNEKQIIKTSKWVVEHITYADGTTKLSRTNDGFNPFELIGLLEISKDDIISQIKGVVKPNIVKRKVITKAENNE